MTTAYPLSWPDYMPRAKSREAGKFRSALGAALANVEASLKGFSRESGKAVSDIVLSSNVSLGQDKPADPGVAVWFTWDGIRIAIPVDRYTTPEANLQAIHHVLEARRTELRHGTLALVRASLSGLVALPPPARKPWWQILELDRDVATAVIEGRFKHLAALRHPDRPGGSHDAMAELNRARDEALREKGAAA